jgi:hypothetical protein
MKLFPSVKRSVSTSNILIFISGEDLLRLTAKSWRCGGIPFHLLVTEAKFILKVHCLYFCRALSASRHLFTSAVVSESNFLSTNVNCLSSGDVLSLL